MNVLSQQLLELIDALMVVPFVFLLLGGAYLTWKSRFVQVRALPAMLRLAFAKQVPGATPGAAETISPRAALLTAMSTTIGVGNIVGPIVAIGLGGPGALLCYVLATLIGGATIFSEVSLAVRHRHHDARGVLHGGPMGYLVKVRPMLSPLYAFFCSVLLLGWTAANANTIALTLQQQQVPRLTTGILLAVSVVAVLAGGIGRIARLNERLVPLMCTLYVLATLWIVAVAQRAQLGAALHAMLTGFWRPEANVWGIGVSSVVQVLRHGLARALQANEAGVGTSTIPHCMANTPNSQDQATLAMAAVYFNGFLCMLTGLTVLVAGPVSAGTPFDVVLLHKIFAQNFSQWGGYVLALSIFMFAYGTILGNSFNGGHCFAALTRPAAVALYYLASGAAVCAGALFDLQTVFRGIDYLIIPVVALNMTGVLWLVARGAVSFDLALPGAARRPLREPSVLARESCAQRL